MAEQWTQVPHGAKSTGGLFQAANGRCRHGHEGVERSTAGRGALNDAVSIYFADATLAIAFVARWCVGIAAETVGGVFRVRAGLHRTP